MNLIPGRRSGLERLGLLLQKSMDVGSVDLLALGGRDTVVTPLPELASTDLRRRRVFLSGW